MHAVDWAILGALAFFISVVAYRTKRYTRSVADFLSANRCAGKYLLGVGDGIAGLCAISIVALFEMYYKAGFTALWWQTMIMPATLVIAISGWVQYRYRQTRAMTMAQFFEIRYSRRFRVFAGIMGFVSGTINFGIFPAVGGRFFQYYCGLPNYFVWAGLFQVDLVYAGIMAALLILSLCFTLWGGQIAVMVTDFIQGVFCNFMFVIIALYLLCNYDWEAITQAAGTAPADASLINPMRTSETDNFNIYYFLVQVFGVFFTFMAWQGNQGYYGAARTPHDARMGRVIGNLRPIVQALPLVLLPVCAYTFMHHAQYAQGANEAQNTLSGIASEQIRSQLTVSVALSRMLPVGMLGGFAAVMFAAFVSTHDTYLHAWGSMFIQDVILPVRNMWRGSVSPLSAKAHLWLLRGSIIGVAVFIFVFSLLFNQQQDIFMFFALTGTIYLGWAGTAIIGGLYWKRGNTTGVWAAAIAGVVLAIAGWYMTYFWANCRNLLGTLFPAWWAEALVRWPYLSGGETGNRCPITAQVLWFYTMVGTALVYVVVSLVSGRGRVFNLDRMLHRGVYCRDAEKGSSKPLGWGARLLGITGEHTFGDKCLVLGSFGYVVVSSVVFLGGTVYALSVTIEDRSWMSFWWIYSWVMIAAMMIISVWVFLGGLRDMKSLMQVLKTARRDDRDDGTVFGNRNLDELDETELKAQLTAEREDS